MGRTLGCVRSGAASSGAAAGTCSAEVCLAAAWCVGRERRILFALGGFKWSLLNDYRRLLVGSIYFNFSRWVGVSVESSLQALSWQRSEGVGCFAFHPQLPFYYACLLKTQPVFSRGNVNISKQGGVQLTRAKSHFIGSVKK